MSKPVQELTQSRIAPAGGSFLTSILPGKAPAPARQMPVLARMFSKLRVINPPVPHLKPANPGLDLMEEVELIKADLLAQLPNDPHLRRMMVRHDALLREGEGREAARDASDIDAYVAEQAIRYARLRRKETGKKGFRVTGSAAFCSIEYSHDRPAVAAINFSITGAGHAARGTVRITI